jgi:hypothetical protein
MQIYVLTLYDASIKSQWTQRFLRDNGCIV